MDVCIKFDEVAQYVIDRNLGRAITREEVREIVKTGALAVVFVLTDALPGRPD
jgi:hypothetical protein